MNRVCASRVSRAVICAVSVMVLCTALLATASAQDVAVSEVGRPPLPMAGSLPWTAGELPLLALTGFLCLGASFSLRRLWVR